MNAQQLYSLAKELEAADEVEVLEGNLLPRVVEALKGAARVDALINTPEVEQFLRGTHLEAVHQVERWGEASDRGKRQADWFWLVGYLAGKALHSSIAGNVEKAKHHCISTAAALYNWHCAISGTDTRMAPGSSDVAKIVEAAFPGEGA